MLIKGLKNVNLPQMEGVTCIKPTIEADRKKIHNCKTCEAPICVLILAQHNATKFLVYVSDYLFLMCPLWAGFHRAFFSGFLFVINNRQSLSFF